MSIAAAVRTGSAVVLAADSRVTAPVIAGENPDGSVIRTSKVFDNGTKVAQDRSGSAIAAFTGYGGVDVQAAVRHFTGMNLSLWGCRDAQDARVAKASRQMARARVAYSFPGAEDLREMTAILAAPLQDSPAPRVWRIELSCEEPRVEEIRERPGLWLEGSIGFIFPALYGLGGPTATRLKEALGVDDATWEDALRSGSASVPANQINFEAMPLQDAIDFAAFCVRTQVAMSGFLPHQTSGGPVDVMTLEAGQKPRIRTFPGKSPGLPSAIP